MLGYKKILCTVACIGMLTTFSLATEERAMVKVYDITQLNQAIQQTANVNIRLEMDISTEQPLWLSAFSPWQDDLFNSYPKSHDKTVVIDLNGHMLRINNVLNNTCDLTIMDSLGTGALIAEGIYNNNLLTLDNVVVKDTRSSDDRLFCADADMVARNGFICSRFGTSLTLKSGKIFAHGENVHAIKLFGASCSIDGTKISAEGENAVGVMCVDFKLLFGAMTNTTSGTAGWTTSELHRSKLYIQSGEICATGTQAIGCLLATDDSVDFCSDCTIMDGIISSTGDGATGIWYNARRSRIVLNAGTIEGTASAINTGEAITADIGYVTVDNMFVAVSPNTTIISAPFADVNAHAWYYTDIRFVNDCGYMVGDNTMNFAPNDDISRAMFITILYRMSGAKDIGVSSFADVPDNTWYTNSIYWAEQNQIIKGTATSTYSPDIPITREQLVTLLRRYIEVIHPDIVSEIKSTQTFNDYDTVSDYAKEAVDWAISNSLLIGINQQLKPQDTVTRAETATILMRYSKL